MKNNKGWTIIQTMVVLLIAGVVASIVVDKIIDKRCETEPSRQICAER